MANRIGLRVIVRIVESSIQENQQLKPQLTLQDGIVLGVELTMGTKTGEQLIVNSGVTPLDYPTRLYYIYLHCMPRLHKIRPDYRL